MTHAPSLRRVPLLRQAALLFRRSWLQNVRDKATNVSRAASNVSSAAIFGSIFWRLGRSQISVQNRMGLLQVRCARPACSPALSHQLSWMPGHQPVYSLLVALGTAEMRSDS